MFRSFSVAFFVMLRDQNHLVTHPEFNEPWTALLYTFNMMFGEFDIDYFKTAPGSPVIAVLLFVAFMVVIPTVMLNALIAVMVSNLSETSKMVLPNYLTVVCMHVFRVRPCPKRKRTRIRPHSWSVLN